MNRKTFEEKVLLRRIAKTREVLSSKADEYSVGGSAFYNFEEAAKIDDETPEEALWGMMKKHFVSVKDMKDGKVQLSNELIDEKIGDLINYLILLEGILIEKIN